MNCGLDRAKPDWKAYVLGEMDAPAQRAAEAHASSCEACQEEVASLRITLDAMATLREEEMPRRIAFVSDKVFEPKWWQMFLKPSFADVDQTTLCVNRMQHCRCCCVQPRLSRLSLRKQCHPAQVALTHFEPMHHG